MQVFKTFMKVAVRKLPSVIMYFAIFATIVFIMAANASSEADKGFESSKLKVCVTDLDDSEGFEAEVRQNKAMGFDGKSLINPKQIRLVHEVFAPTEKDVMQAEAMVRAFCEAAAAGIGVFTVNGKMVDVAFIPGAERTLRLAKACGMYEGELV